MSCSARTRSDALDVDERAQVDELLLTDPSARAELHELEQGAAWLGHASLRPPERAWDAIAAEVEADLAAERDADVVSLGSRRSRWSRSQRWLAAAAVALVVAVGGVTVVVGRRPIGTSVGGVAVRSGSPQSRAPDGRRSRRRRARRAHAAVVLPDGVGYVDTSDMSSPGPGRDLQLWSITPDGPVSAGLMRGPGTIQRFRVAPARPHSRSRTSLAVGAVSRPGSRSSPATSRPPRCGGRARPPWARPASPAGSAGSGASPACRSRPKASPRHAIPASTNTARTAP